MRLSLGVEVETLQRPAAARVVRRTALVNGKQRHQQKRERPLRQAGAVQKARGAMASE
jgi:hypothetical protein